MKTPVTQAFGRAVRSIRSEQGYGQESFAAHAGLDRSYYGAIERGESNVSLETMMKIASGLGVPVLSCFAERSSDPSRKPSRLYALPCHP